MLNIVRVSLGVFLILRMHLKVCSDLKPLRWRQKNNEQIKKKYIHASNGKLTWLIWARKPGVDMNKFK